MGDPLFADGVDWGDAAVVGVKVVVAFVFLLVATMFMVWFERKVVGDMQNRIGPNVAGPWGILQTFADGVKFFFKEDLRPAEADPLVFRLAPYISATTAFLAFAIVPVGGVFEDTEGVTGTVEIFGKETFLQVADPPVGILFLLAVSSIAVYGIMLAGWSSGSKYPLLGSVRASAQAISYEAALSLSVATVVLVAGTLSTHRIVAGQAGGIDTWNVLVTGLVTFVIFLISATAELNRPPFDLVEAEQELVGGFHTEYSSIRFALFFLAEFMNVITMSAIMVTLFFGGPAGPVFFGMTWFWPTVWFAAKVLVFLFAFVWFRATLPRLRYDQLMNLGWKLMIPLALGWLLVISAVRLRSAYDWNPVVTFAIGLAIAVPCVLLLLASFRAGDRAYVREMTDAGTLPGGVADVGYLDGFRVTFNKLFDERVTTEYPKVKRPKPERFHGRHVLNRYEDGMEKCIGCELCAGVCPARCIYVRGADNPPDDPVSPGERYGFVYEINYLRCIHCDLCVEACPTEAITESKLFEFSFTNRADAIYTREELLVDEEGQPKRQPWELWMVGDDALTSGWMRATAPAGDADYTGKVAWSAELGYGIRDPEPSSEAEP